jgi:3-hydroxybutyryl-CoA dehydrogenase
MTKEIATVCVVGSGTMGRGIAQNAAASGLDVVLVDADPQALARGMDAIRDVLAGLVGKAKIDATSRNATLSRIGTAPSATAGAAGADLVVEAVPESLDLKMTVFRDLDGAAPAHAILATNTSSLPVGAIAAATGRPARVVGMHFFNPVPVMPLLEVVQAEATSDATVEAAVAVGRRMGKDPIVVRDRPGFATSRLGVLLGLEAIRMLEQGVASAEDIDKAMTLGYRHPMGPLRLSDLVGLDVRLAIAEHLERALGSSAFTPPELLRRMVAQGKLGKKSGEGFYRWGARGRA